MYFHVGNNHLYWYKSHKGRIHEPKRKCHTIQRLIYCIQNFDQRMSVQVSGWWWITWLKLISVLKWVFEKQVFILNSKYYVVCDERCFMVFNSGSGVNNEEFFIIANTFTEKSIECVELFCVKRKCLTTFWIFHRIFFKFTSQYVSVLFNS